MAPLLEFTECIAPEERDRMLVWAVTPGAAEAVGQLLDPGAWAHADFVVSRNRAREKGRALLDRFVDAIK